MIFSEIEEDEDVAIKNRIAHEEFRRQRDKRFNDLKAKVDSVREYLANNNYTPVTVVIRCPTNPKRDAHVERVKELHRFLKSEFEGKVYVMSKAYDIAPLDINDYYAEEGIDKQILYVFFERKDEALKFKLRWV
jgi:hypothetical protein